MEKYNLFLKIVGGEEPRQLMIKDMEGPIVPLGGHIIISSYLTNYIKTVAIKHNNLKYITNFSDSRFIVREVEHIPEEKKGKLEATVTVTAIKI